MRKEFLIGISLFVGIPIVIMSSVIIYFLIIDADVHRVEKKLMNLTPGMNKEEMLEIMKGEDIINKVESPEHEIFYFKCRTVASDMLGNYCIIDKKTGLVREINCEVENYNRK